MELPYDLAIPFPGIYITKRIENRNSEIFVQPYSQKNYSEQPKRGINMCPSREECINKMWHDNAAKERTHIIIREKQEGEWKERLYKKGRENIGVKRQEERQILLCMFFQDESFYKQLTLEHTNKSPINFLLNAN